MSIESRDVDDSEVEDVLKDEEEDDELKVCQVCGDTATGYHFNAMTCEGCKGFFRRAMKGTPNFRCAFQNKCVITKNNRRQCQSCRLQKCLSIGMLKDLIMSDEAVEKRRTKIRRKKMAKEPVVLSQDQKNVLQDLVTAHKKTFDVTFSNFIQFRPLDRDQNNIFGIQLEPSLTSKQSSDSIQHQEICNESSIICDSSFVSRSDEEEEGCSNKKEKIFTSLPHITDLSTFMIQNIINFAKMLKTFRNLTIEDQISLLKGATFEVCQIRFNMLFNEKTGIWECGSLRYCMNDAQRAGFQSHLLEPLMKFHYTLRRLQLREEEYVLMQAISLFSPDRPGVTQPKEIDELQESIALTLMTYIESQRQGPEKNLLYPKIMACLTELRTMNEEHSKQVLQIQDIQPDVPPLYLEIVSKH